MFGSYLQTFHIWVKFWSHMYFFLLFSSFFTLKNGQFGGASRWRICYQRGLPRLATHQLCLCIHLKFLEATYKLCKYIGFCINSNLIFRSFLWTFHMSTFELFEAIYKLCIYIWFWIYIHLIFLDVFNIYIFAASSR